MTDPVDAGTPASRGGAWSPAQWAAPVTQGREVAA